MAKEKPKPIKVKITCKTPEGKAIAAAKSFKKMFSMIKKPVEEVITSSESVYFIYEYARQKDVDRVINRKVPKIEQTIRTYYIIIIKIVERSNKLAKKGAWKLERTRRWILNRLVKKGYDKKEMEDFVDGVNLDDKDYMMKFLGQELISVEVL